MEVVDRLVIWSVVWPVVSGFVGVPSVFNGSLFSLLRPLSLPKSILSLGLLLSFSLTASSCLRSGKKNNAHHLVKYGVSGEYTPNKFPPLKYFIVQQTCQALFIYHQAYTLHHSLCISSCGSRPFYSCGPCFWQNMTLRLTLSWYKSLSFSQRNYA